MINFNRFHINILSVFISLLIFSIIILLMENPKSNFIENESILNENKSISIYNAQNEEDVSDKNWYIEIEDLNLKANIKELLRILFLGETERFQFHKMDVMSSTPSFGNLNT